MKRFFPLFLASLCVLMTACQSGPPSSGSSAAVSDPPKTASGASGDASAAPKASAAGTISYPLENSPTFTWAVAEDATISTISKSLSETPFIKELEKRTGVRLEIQHPADFSLIFASGDLPDLISYYPNSYPGGASKLVKDKIVNPIGDEIEQFAPDFANALASNDIWRKGSTTPDGDIVGFPFIRGDELLLGSSGLMIRKDWLDELELEAPATPEELIQVLTLFKEQKGAAAPLSVTGGRAKELFEHGVFTSPFNIPRGSFFQADGKVRYGYYMEEFKDYLAFMNELYTKGLLDKNFNTTDGNTVNANFMNGTAGLTYAPVGGGMGNYLSTMEAKDPTYDIAGMRGLVATKGDRPMAGQKEFPNQGLFVMISSACKDKESAMNYLNYAYTQEGNLLYNFGIEGVSYTMVDGYPTFTEEIMKNPDGLTMQQSLSKYCRSWVADGFIQDRRYMEQFGGRPQQKEALSIWADNDVDLYNLPPLTIPAEFTAEYSKISNDVNTFISESYQKFIIGVDPLDTAFPTYMATLKEMGIERMIELRQLAFDEYNNR